MIERLQKCKLIFYSTSFTLGNNAFKLFNDLELLTN